MANLNIIRARTKLNEMFHNKIDMSDFPLNQDSHFETRAIAATVLMMRAGIDATEASKHITDGYHDMGIDAIYLDRSQRSLFLVQTKWRNSGDGTIKQSEMLTFIAGVKRILELDLDGANKHIQDKTNEITEGLTEMGYQIHLIFAHTGKETTSAFELRPATELCEEVNDEISTILYFSEICFSEIYEFLAMGQNSDGISLNDVILTNWGMVEAPYTGYYGTISASAIGEWYAHHGNSLFSKNIRFYKGDTDVNAGMKRTLLTEPENFFYYNNGIKLLCSSITRKAKLSTTTKTGLFHLDGVSLVNGAQTAGTIGITFAENPEQVSKANVLIQIIDLSSATPETYSLITKLSNTQNRIENKDFASLDPEQNRICADLAFSHYTYLYKSGDKLTNMDTQVTLDEAVIGLACLYDDITYSTLSKRNVGALTEDITKAPYKALFNPSTNSFSLLNSILINRQIEKALATRIETTAGRDRLVLIHGNRFLAHCILQKMKKNPLFEKSVLSQSDIVTNVDTLLQHYYPHSLTAINELYPDSYPANLFKNSSKCKAIFEKIPKVP